MDDQAACLAIFLSDSKTPRDDAETERLAKEFLRDRPKSPLVADVRMKRLIFLFRLDLNLTFQAFHIYPALAVRGYVGVVEDEEDALVAATGQAFAHLGLPAPARDPAQFALFTEGEGGE